MICDNLTVSPSGHLLFAGQDTVELAKQWRTDRALRNLNAMMLVSDGSKLFMITGTGDVLDPEGDVMGIGSGGS